jgi:hypothetical protein
VGVTVGVIVGVTVFVGVIVGVTVGVVVVVGVGVGHIEPNSVVLHVSQSLYSNIDTKSYLTGGV